MFAHAENATHLVLGATRRSRLSALLPWPAATQRVIRRAGSIDVHIVTCTPRRRQAAATAVGPAPPHPTNLMVSRRARSRGLPAQVAWAYGVLRGRSRPRMLIWRV
jgi:two-component system, OmpR family, sensor histidine kinase KdpD